MEGFRLGIPCFTFTASFFAATMAEFDGFCFFPFDFLDHCTEYCYLDYWMLLVNRAHRAIRARPLSECGRALRVPYVGMHSGTVDERVSHTLRESQKGESEARALHQFLWIEEKQKGFSNPVERPKTFSRLVQDDITSQYADFIGFMYETLWTFDLDHDKLLFDKSDRKC